MRIGTDSARFYVPLKPVFYASREIYKVAAADRVEIAPRTCQEVSVRVRDLEIDVEGCIEGMDLNHQSLLIARSLNITSSGMTKVQCINYAEHPVVLHKNQNVATFGPLGVGMHTVRASHSDGRIQLTEETLVEMFDLEPTDLTEHQKEIVYTFL